MCMSSAPEIALQFYFHLFVVYFRRTEAEKVYSATCTHTRASQQPPIMARTAIEFLDMADKMKRMFAIFLW